MNNPRANFRTTPRVPRDSSSEKSSLEMRLPASNPLGFVVFTPTVEWSLQLLLMSQSGVP